LVGCDPPVFHESFTSGPSRLRRRILKDPQGSPVDEAEGYASTYFAENELSPALISLSPLDASHPRSLQRPPVRPSKPCYRFFSLDTSRSTGFASRWREGGRGSSERPTPEETSGGRRPRPPLPRETLHLRFHYAFACLRLSTPPHAKSQTHYTKSTPLHPRGADGPDPGRSRGITRGS